MRRLTIVAGVLIALAPWMGGGRDALSLLIATFGLIIAAFLVWRQDQLHTGASLLLRIAVTGLVVWSAASMLWTVNRYQTELWVLFLLLAVVSFSLVRNFSLTQKAALLKGYVWVAVVAVLYGVYLYFTVDYDRFTSSFYWANPCAAFLLPAAIIAGGEAIGSIGRRLNPVAMIQSLILLVGFWLTDSRGAILIAAVVLVGALVYARVGRRVWLYSLGIIVLTLAAAWGLSALRTHYLHFGGVTPGSRFAEAALGESSSGRDRLNFIGSAFSIWKDHPLLGTGAGTYATVHPQYQQNVVSASSDAHNLIAQTFAELGLVGGLLLVYIGLLVIVGIFRGFRRHPETGPAAVGALFLLLHYCIEIDDRYPALIVLAAVLVAVSYRPWLELPLTRAQKLTMPLLMGVALIISVANYQSDAQRQRGLIYDDNHQLQQAADSYAKAHASLVYDPDVWTAEGIDYYSFANITGGSKHYGPLAADRARQAIARDPRDSQHYVLLGREEWLDQHLDEAVWQYRQAIRLDRYNHPEYYLDLALVQRREGRYDEANRTVQTALSYYPDQVVSNRHSQANLTSVISELYALRSSYEQSRGQTAEAQADIQKALQVDPSNQDARHLIRN